MTPSNVSPDWLDHATTDEVAKLPVEVLATLKGELDTQADKLKVRKARLQAGLVQRYVPSGNFIPGTGYVADGAYKIRMESKRTVEWTQDLMAKAAKAIDEQGLDPWALLKVEYAVAEATYKAMTPAVKALVEPARTVKVSQPTFTFIGGEAAPEALAA